MTAKQVAIGAIAAALFLAAVPSFAAGPAPPISPAAGSDSVLARLDAEPELRLQYRVECAGAPAEIVTIVKSLGSGTRSPHPGVSRKRWNWDGRPASDAKSRESSRDTSGMPCRNLRSEPIVNVQWMA